MQQKEINMPRVGKEYYLRKFGGSCYLVVGVNRVEGGDDMVLFCRGAKTTIPSASNTVSVTTLSVWKSWDPRQIEDASPPKCSSKENPPKNTLDDIDTENYCTKSHWPDQRHCLCWRDNKPCCFWKSVV